MVWKGSAPVIPVIKSFGGKMLKDLFGTKVVESAHAVTANRKFTRKQTRKFTNTRWVKKYKKKYSYIEYEPGAFFIAVNNTLIIHPTALKALQKSKIIKSTNEAEIGNFSQDRPILRSHSLYHTVVA